jgi:uncharacterized MAPEG superfamily protein
MAKLELISLLALIEYAVLGLMVGSARAKFGVAAPATTGDPNFERYFRAHQNTLEALVVFLPALWIFAERVSEWGAVILGIGFLLARAEYARGYILSPEGRTLGAQATYAINGVLLIGSVIGVLLHAV